MCLNITLVYIYFSNFSARKCLIHIACRVSTAAEINGTVLISKSEAGLSERNSYWGGG